MEGNKRKTGTNPKAVIGLIAVCLIAVLVSLIFNVYGENSTSISLVKPEKYLADPDNPAQTTQGTVNIKYVDSYGNNIAEQESISGTLGEEYSISRKTINGYRAKGNDPINKKGNYDTTTPTVTFVYEEFSSEVRSSSDGENVVVQVVKDNEDSVNKEYKLKIVTKDGDGNALPNSKYKVTGQNSTVIRDGTDYTGTFVVGSLTVNNTTAEQYTIEQTPVSGYNPLDENVVLTINKTKDSNTGEYFANASVSDVDGVSVTVDENNDEIIVNIINDRIPDPEDDYKVRIEYKINGQLINNVRLGVAEGTGSPVEKTTSAGIINLEDKTVTADGTTTYKISEIEVPEGYDPILGEGVEAIVNVTATLNTATRHFEFSVTKNNIEGLSARLDGNTVVITLSGVKEEDKYDLALKKFISKIDDQEITNREPKVKKAAEGYSYEMNTEMEKAANGQKVTYTLRTFNESERNGEGKIVNELIPKGLVFLPEDSVNIENGWRMYKKVNGNLVEVTDASEAELIATDKIAGTAIPGYNGDAAEGEEVPLSHLDVKAVFVIDESVFSGKENRIIENTAQIEPNDNDNNTDNDITTEKIYVKYFDLQLKKKVKEVKITTPDGNTITKTKNNDELVKIDIPRSKINGTVLDVTYTLTVSNVGEIPGYITDIEDQYPNGMKLAEGSVWTMQDIAAVYTELADIPLNPGESTDVEIKLTWTLTENDIGVKTNVATISSYYNLNGARDITPDNNAEEPLLISVKTGKRTIITLEVIAALVLAIGLVLYIKKRNK